uniref:Uncharacterized protein n=1 Tax=Rhinolophus ferrumequinum TaxID=59479 RepID=A0A671FJL7_RHIFE
VTYLSLYEKGKAHSRPFLPHTSFLAYTGPHSAEGGKPCGVCQTLLAILGTADIWAPASPSLSLKIQLSFCLKFHLRLLSQVVVDTPWGLILRARSSRGKQTGSEHISIYREQNQASECPQSNVQIAVMGRVKPLPRAQLRWQTRDCCGNAAEYTRVYSQTFVQ